MYDWLVAAVLGIVQALTEFLPISSSAHVRIVGELMLPGDDPGAFFTAIIQIGTEAAVVVYFWRWVGKRERTLEDMSWGQGIIFGFAQALAVIPGVSRSGGTIMAGRFMGFDRPAAARYSFLLAIPAVLGSGFYGVLQTLGRTDDMVLGWGPTILATIIAFVLGLFVIHWFLGYVKTKSFGIFVWYRVVLGIVLYVLLGTGVLAAV
jgi:undecaprenyl pyrophosphate phosphatase UppP